MKILISLLCLISFSSLGCETEFPKNLECRKAGAMDEDLIFEFEKKDSGSVFMTVYALNVSGQVPVAGGLFTVRGTRLKASQMKVKFSKDFKVMKYFKAKGSSELNRTKFNCQ